MGDALEQLQAEVAATKVQINSLKRRVGKLRVDIKAIRQEYDDGVLRRIDDMTRRVQTDVLRLCIVTEMGRLYHRVWPPLIRALEMPDEWWHQKNQLSLDGWLEVLEEIEREVMSD